MIPRELAPLLQSVARQYPVVTLTGPRQSGKTTLVRATFPGHEYASLEEPDHTTARRWLSILEASFLVYLLRPYHASFGKRLIKSPKL